jgi:transposase
MPSRWRNSAFIRRVLSFACQQNRRKPTANSSDCEYSSGGKQRRGHITHWGPPALRRLLVEATWIWVSKDTQAQQRFHSIRAGKSPKVAIVGMARRLAVALWAMTVKKQEFAYHWKR